MIDSADALSEKIDNDVTVISPPQSLNGNDSVEEVAEPVRADDGTSPAFPTLRPRF